VLICYFISGISGACNFWTRSGNRSNKDLGFASVANTQNCEIAQGFPWINRYYRKIIQNYGTIGRPLTELLKKNASFLWTLVTEDAFQSLKQKLCEAPVLGVPDFAKQFVIETDACDQGVGAVLM
jgi:hypothetical protein